ncbi:6-hydroxymethylpterin diphosphokinase MptE-like protein [Proteocatella sphenisci]|uniref:6-hydroxymethylpterin diphosphokinase MptE-like protein n=1 Tax=Proteocatella sphenisci TaxID=181070 RepID=UPI0004B96E62|nr:6-hydroxymethylpterin diphosphokinase MptE-like protein [Proteocatella sphenisci]
MNIKGIKKLIKSNDQLYKLFINGYRFKYYFFNIIFRLKAFLRKYNISSNEYRQLENFKNKHKGERCFIICTGPSLTISDLEKLKDEYTISMNSICLALDNTEWRPTYYGIQDEGVYSKVESKLKELGLSRVFVSDNIAKKFNVNKEWTKYPLNKYYNAFEYRFRNRYFVKFSNDCKDVVYDGFSVTFSMIQLAIYLGFNEIYLLGCDNNYSNDMSKQHFVESGHYDSRYKTAGDRMTVGYEAAKKYADKNGIKIMNATRGGSLEVFKRVSFDVII